MDESTMNGQGRIWLFEIEEVFHLSDFRLVVTCKLNQEVKLVVNDQLTILCPDGQVVNTSIVCFPLVTTTRHKELSIIELQETDETKSIVAGAQVFRQGLGR
jgi:hypothetical protein